VTHKESQITVGGWARALDDARRQLAAAKKRVKELTIAIRVCEERVRDGEPFPGERQINGQEGG
jgi:hypothetical protein